MTARGRLQFCRGEFAWPLSARGAYTILSDEHIEIGGLGDFNYCWHALMGGTGEGVQVKGGAGVRGASPVGSRGEAPARAGGGGRAPRLSRKELKMFHKQILSRNEAWFVKIRRQMTTERKNYNFTLNINYLLYTSKSISFSHTFVYYRSILYSMLFRFFKVESAVIEMIGKRRTFFFTLPLGEQFVHLLVSFPGFRRQQFVADDSVRLCI